MAVSYKRIWNHETVASSVDFEYLPKNPGIKNPFTLKNIYFDIFSDNDALLRIQEKEEVLSNPSHIQKENPLYLKMNYKHRYKHVSFKQ